MLRRNSVWHKRDASDCPDIALDERFLAQMRSQYASDQIHNGVFGAMMRVGLVNDGPVTIELDSNAREPGQMI